MVVGEYSSGNPSPPASLPPDVTYNVLVTILTDGEKNSLSSYSHVEVKKMIDELKTGSLKLLVCY